MNDKNNYSQKDLEILTSENQILIDQAWNILRLNFLDNKEQILNLSEIEQRIKNQHAELEKFKHFYKIKKKDYENQLCFQALVILELIKENLVSHDDSNSIVQQGSILSHLLNEHVIPIELSYKAYNMFSTLNENEKKNFILDHLNSEILRNEVTFSQKCALQKKQKMIEIESYYGTKTSIYNNNGQVFDYTDVFLVVSGQKCNLDELLNLFKKIYGLLSNQKPMDVLTDLLNLHQKKITQYFGTLERNQIHQYFEKIFQIAKEIIQIEQQLDIFIGNSSIKLENIIKEWTKKAFKFLEDSYCQLEPKFQDKFYNFQDETQIDIFVDQPSFRLDWYFQQTGGHCAYQFFPEGLIVYYKLSGYSQLCFKNNQFKEDGLIGQLILADKDEEMKVLKLIFSLKDKYSKILVNKQKFHITMQQLIDEVLLKVVTVKTKRLILQPNWRENVKQQFYVL